MKPPPDSSPQRKDVLRARLVAGGGEMGKVVRALDWSRIALGPIDFVPDIAFIDVGLPGIDGSELATRLRPHRSCQSSVLVALTGYGLEQDKRRAMEAGFDHHLTKPVDFDAIDRLLANVSRAAVAVQDERAQPQ